MFAVIRPVIARKAKFYCSAVDGIQRILELEFMFRGMCHDTSKNFFKQRLENFRGTVAHRFEKRGFCRGFHAEVIKTFGLQAKLFDDFFQNDIGE